MNISEAICPQKKLTDTLVELYEGGADVKFILPHEFKKPPGKGFPWDLKVSAYRILYQLPDERLHGKLCPHGSAGACSICGDEG